ncbi:MAG: TRAP transporter small permease [Firmicutes bacterium]|nr:TRAP transporter small permease [Bacillota bacterium]
MQKIDRAVAQVEEVFVAMGLLGSTMLMFLNVVLRYVFKSGLPWSEELIRFTIIWITFVGIGLCVRKGSHVAIDFFAYYMSKKQQRYLTVIVDSICILYCALMAYYSIQLIGKQFDVGQKAPALQVPFYIIYLCLPIGFTLGIVRFAQDLVSKLAER